MGFEEGVCNHLAAVLPTEAAFPRFELSGRPLIGFGSDGLVDLLRAMGGLPEHSFGGVAARTYTIEFTDALGNGTWFRLTNIIARATNHTEQILDPSYTTNRFYRIATPWRP